MFIGYNGYRKCSPQSIRSIWLAYWKKMDLVKLLSPGLNNQKWWKNTAIFNFRIWCSPGEPYLSPCVFFMFRDFIFLIKIDPPIKNIEIFTWKLLPLYNICKRCNFFVDQHYTLMAFRMMLSVTLPSMLMILQYSLL